MAIEISRIDPLHDADVDAWWNAYATAERADRGTDAVVWSLSECRSELQQESAVVDRRAYLLRDGDQVVGSASLALPLKDNTHVAHLAVSVPPRHRRRGIGSEALAFLEGEAVASGRTTAHGSTSWPYERGSEGIGSPGREFARARGYELALGDVQSRLVLPVDPSLLDRIEAEIAGSTEGYEIRSWVGRIPDEVVERWTILDATLETEAPTGDLDIEPQKPDVDSIRESEELIERQRRLSFGTIALAPDGGAAAYSQLVVSADDGNAYQWGTLVRAADRGHRLGMAVKVTNLRTLHREAPRTTAVYTYNAESNAHMLAVNTLLGFLPSERLGELQKRLI
ncbi:GNAT family N-acetyltransferase [Microbacterium phyllosphaerae]|uniref:GNAT family N-acetyltransferase n=1 Tax=Microbacterium phyllosphaerae TaxID=124798 RepID=UPI00216A64C0|nr:GNAT family N-acetyltransferase [Microbacterium phyllosphaerae]MCS3442251.1 GNAT superfamily N-acetyltransferase [Microbacterium phyllosphaerae]